MLRRGTAKAQSGFTLLEVILAMGVFAIAAVALMGALNLISVSVVETIDESEVREQLRSQLISVSRDRQIREKQLETPINAKGIFFRTVVERNQQHNNAEGVLLENLFEVTVTAIRREPNGREIEIDSASTLCNPRIF